MDTRFTEWERQIFPTLADVSSSVADINDVLSKTPAQISSTVYRIIRESMMLSFQLTEEKLAEEFRAADQVHDERLVLHLVEWSQNPYNWADDAEVLNEHMKLVDAIMDDETLLGESGFLMFVWEQILSEIREKTEGHAPDEETFERFAYFVDKIEEYANM